MSKLKTALATGVAAMVGLVAVRKLRERRRTPARRPPRRPGTRPKREPLAAKHAVAAAGHARVAGEKATETARDELPEAPRRGARATDAVADTDGDSGRRLRKAGKGWIRR